MWQIKRMINLIWCNIVFNFKARFPTAVSGQDLESQNLRDLKQPLWSWPGWNPAPDHTESREAKWNRWGRRRHDILTGLVSISQCSWLLQPKKGGEEPPIKIAILMDDMSFLGLLGFFSWHVENSFHTNIEHALFRTFCPALHPAWVTLDPDTITSVQTIL